MCSAPGDGADRVRYLVLLELVGTEQYGVCVLGVVARLDLVLLLGELPKAVGADLVEGLDLELARGVRGRVAVGLPLAPAVLDGDVREGGGGGRDRAGGEAEGRRRPAGRGPQGGVHCRDHCSQSLPIKSGVKSFSFALGVVEERILGGRGGATWIAFKMGAEIRSIQADTKGDNVRSSAGKASLPSNSNIPSPSSCVVASSDFSSASTPRVHVMGGGYGWRRC